MVRFYELSCLAKSVYFILQETVLWFSYFICGVGGDGVGKVFVCVCVCLHEHLCLCVCLYVNQHSHCMFTEESGTLKGGGIFSLSHKDG